MFHWIIIGSALLPIGVPVASAEMLALTSSSSVKAYVERVAPDSTFARIVGCESNFEPLARNEKAVVGVDIGPAQINTYYHQKEATDLGFDIFDPKQNILFAVDLYKKEGSRPWNASKACWK